MFSHSVIIICQVFLFWIVLISRSDFFIEITNEKIFSAVDKYSTLLFRISFFHVKSKMDAEDIVQETFLALKEKSPDIASEEHLKAWLIKVAINKCKNLRKSSAWRKNVPLDESIIHRYNFDEGNIEITECLYKLKPLDRDIIFLHYYEGFSAKEVGKIVGKREEAVFKRLERGREKLKKFLEE